MPSVCKKICRLFDRGFDPETDKGKFRHVKGNNIRYQNSSNHPSTKYASRVARKLYSIFKEYGFPGFAQKLIAKA